MSAQTCISTKMLTVITFQWWQYGWFLILFCTLIYATLTMPSWSHFVVKLSSPRRDTAGFRNLPCPCCGTRPPVSSPASLLGGLWVSRPCSLTPPQLLLSLPSAPGGTGHPAPTPPQFCRTCLRLSLCCPQSLCDPRAPISTPTPPSPGTLPGAHLGLTFRVCKIGKILVPHSQCCCGDKDEFTSSIQRRPGT